MRRYSTIGAMLADISRRHIAPGDVIGCVRCEWQGPTNLYAGHLLICPDLEYRPRVEPNPPTRLVTRIWRRVRA